MAVIFAPPLNVVDPETRQPVLPTGVEMNGSAVPMKSPESD